MPHSTTQLKEAIDRDGFVVVPSGLNEEQLDELRTACTKVTELARAGKWPHIRTLPRQFPPWPSDPSQGIWGVQQLMNPDLPGHELFTKSYFSDATIRTVQELLGGCSEEDLVMELYNLLVTPDHDFELRWHRDDIPPTATPAEEMERLGKPAWHAQWNFPLYPDSSLILVPKSHLRPLTDEERDANPLEADMPGQIHVQLQPGEMAFYNNNIYHRGAYRSDVQRMTLHGSIGHVAGGPLRARNVLQHGREWIGKVDLSRVENLPRAEGMRRRLMELGDAHKATGYSQDD